MKALHAFEGIGGITLGLERAGIESAGGIEIDKFCNRVLERRWPDVPRWNDVREFAREGSAPAFDVVTGGVPCQGLSVAGRRAGLADSRSGLFFEFVRIVDTVAPAWVLFENVAGLLSSKSSASASFEDADPDGDEREDFHAGEDFAVLLGELTGFRPAVPADGWQKAGVCIGPKRAAAWRLFDSQYFGVPQRRKRVFVVCHPRAEFAAAVLFEPESGSGDPPPRRQPGQDVAGTLGLGTPGSRGVRTTDLDGHGAYIPETAYAVRSSQLKQNGSPERGDVTLVSEPRAIDARNGTDGEIAHTLQGGGAGRERGFSLNAQPLVYTPKAYGIRSDAVRDGKARTLSPDAEGRRRLRDAAALPIYAELAPTLDQNGKHMVAMSVDGRDTSNTLKRDDGYVSEDGTGRQPGFVVTQDVAAPITGGGHPNSNIPSRHMEDDTNLVATFNVQPVSTSEVRNALEARDTDVSEAVTHRSADRTERGTMAVFRKSRRAQNHDDAETWVDDGIANTVTPFDQGDVRATTIAAVDEMTVRRLTVTEQERLQGFPDGWTHLCDKEPYESRTCECPDGPRVGAIGNAVTVNVAEWIGRRIVAVAEAHDT